MASASASSEPTVPSQTIVINTSVPEQGDDEWGAGIGSYLWENCNLMLNGDWAPEAVVEFEDVGEGEMNWSGTDADTLYSMTGSGNLGDMNRNSSFHVIGSGKFVIGSGISLVNTEVCVGSGESVADIELSVEGNIQNCGLYVVGGVLDLSKSNFSNYNHVELEAGATLRVSRFEVDQNIRFTIDGYQNQTSHLEGNLSINTGTTEYISTQGEVSYAENEAPEAGCVEFLAYSSFDDETESLEYGCLTVTGNISVDSPSIVLYTNEMWTDEYATEYVEPQTNHLAFVCSGVTKNALDDLMPVVGKCVGDVDWDEDTGHIVSETYTYCYKSLTERKYYAKAGEDGKVYIYLGTTNDQSDESVPSIPGDDIAGGGSDTPETPPAPSVPDFSFVVDSGETVVLGGDESTTPSKDRPLYLQGGTADARGLDNALLNNKVITGSSGLIVTGSSQEMEITGSGYVKYSVVGAGADTPGANLNMKLSGELELQGEQYNTARATIFSGVLSINSGTTLGVGAGETSVEVRAGASLTNFGDIQGDISLADGSTMLNQNAVEGNVVLQGKSTLVNNGSVEGMLTVGDGALLSGTGTAGSAYLSDGAKLHVGNSPGYQKYGNLTLERGAILSFSVDGSKPATATNCGRGTHSVLEVGTLTINPGTGTVMVNVDVTMGIVAAGSGPLSLTLLDAEMTNVTEGDFVLNISDESKLLEKGSLLQFDAATGTLVLKGAVSKAALAALMDSNASNVANTMWASANAIKEMTRTAENQFLVGMPGQTTFWGAAMGGYMDVSSKQGFSCNVGGYAVGLQHAFTGKFRAGMAFGQSYGNFKSDDNQLRVDQMSLIPTMTAQYVTPLTKTSSLSVSGHLAYGVVENEGDTYQTGTKGEAEWDDQVFDIGIRASWNSELTDNVTVSIFTGLSYQMVDQDSFTERFTGGERYYNSGSMSCLSMPIGMTLRGIYQLQGSNVFAPEMTIAYVGDVARNNPAVKSRVYDYNRVGKGANIGRSTLMLSVGGNWMLDSTWSLGAFYTLEARRDQVNQSVNAALRCCF